MSLPVNKWNKSQKTIYIFKKCIKAKRNVHSRKQMTKQRYISQNKQTKAPKKCTLQKINEQKLQQITIPITQKRECPLSRPDNSTQLNCIYNTRQEMIAELSATFWVAVKTPESVWWPTLDAVLYIMWSLVSVFEWHWTERRPKRTGKISRDGCWTNQGH